MAFSIAELWSTEPEKNNMSKYSIWFVVKQWNLLCFIWAGQQILHNSAIQNMPRSLNLWKLKLANKNVYEKSESKKFIEAR